MDKRELRAGAGRAVLTFPEEYFASWPAFTGVHDEIHARALILNNGERVCILSLELPPLEETADVLREMASRVSGIPQDHIWVATTCNFSAPHMLSERQLLSYDKEARHAAMQLNAAIYDAAERAIALALEDMRDARITQSEGESEVNAYRNISTAKGWWIGVNGDAPAARALHVFCIDSLAGEPVATLYHYAVRSSVLYHSVQKDGSVPVSSDLSGQASAYVEEQRGGVAIHLPGACADQVPREVPSCPGTDGDGNLITLESKADALNIMERLGIELGCDILRVAQRDPFPVETPGIAMRSGSVTVERAVCSASREEPATDAEWSAAGEEELPISVLRIGRTAFLGAVPEIDSGTAALLRERTMFLGTLTVQMVNGSASYMPARESFDACTYQALRAAFMPGAAETLVDAAAALLQKAQDAMHDIDPVYLSHYPDRIMDIPYGEHHSQKMDIWYPNERPAEPLPVVLMLHGGAFQHGTRCEDTLEPMLAGLERGYAVVSADYRLAPEAHFPAPIHDGRAAIRFLRAHAETYGLDPERIALWGFSSGGWLVSMTALTAGNPAFEGLETPWNGYSERVQAVVDWCGPCGDFTRMDGELRARGIGFADHDRTDSPESTFMGAPIQEIPELCRLACPMTYVTPDAPPFFLVHGMADPVVPYDQSERFYGALKAAGGEAQLYGAPGKGHVDEYWYFEDRIKGMCYDFLDTILKEK